MSGKRHARQKLLRRINAEWRHWERQRDKEYGRNFDYDALRERLLAAYRKAEATNAD